MRFCELKNSIDPVIKKTAGHAPGYGTENAENRLIAAVFHLLDIIIAHFPCERNKIFILLRSG